MVIKMSEGRIQNSVKNMVFGFMYQIMTLIMSFVSRTVFIRTLGTEYLGLNGIFTDVLSLLSMADLGFGTAMAYSFYKPLAEHDEEKIASLVQFYKKVYNIIAVAVLILGLACVPFLKYFVNTEQDIPDLTAYYLVSLANVVISYLFVYKTTLMTADQKDYKIVNIRMWFTFFKTLVQILVLIFTANYMVYIIVGVLSQFLNNFIASRKTEKEYPYINDRKNRKSGRKTAKNKKRSFLNSLRNTSTFLKKRTLDSGV